MNPPEDSMYGISLTDLNKITTVIYANAKVTQAVLFGSRAKNTYKNGSDIDIALMTNQPLTLAELNAIKIELDDLLLPYKIDLIEFAKITNHELIDHIERVGKIL